MAQILLFDSLAAERAGHYRRLAAKCKQIQRPSGRQLGCSKKVCTMGVDNDKRIVGGTRGCGFADQLRGDPARNFFHQNLGGRHVETS